MATERALKRRTVGKTVGDTVGSTFETLVNPDASTTKRVGAGTAVAVGSAATLGGGIIGIEEFTRHAGPLIGQAWGSTPIELIAGGVSVAAAVGFSLYNVNSSYDGEQRYSSDQQKATSVGVPFRNFLRGTAAVTLTVAGAGALLAGGLDHMSLLGLANAPGAAHVLGWGVDALVPAGIVAAVTAKGWSHRVNRQLGPAAHQLSE